MTYGCEIDAVEAQPAHAPVRDGKGVTVVVRRAPIVHRSEWQLCFKHISNGGLQLALPARVAHEEPAVAR